MAVKALVSVFARLEIKLNEVLKVLTGIFS